MGNKWCCCYKPTMLVDNAEIATKEKKNKIVLLGTGSGGKSVLYSLIHLYYNENCDVPYLCEEFGTYRVRQRVLEVLHQCLSIIKIEDKVEHNKILDTFPVL